MANQPAFIPSVWAASNTTTLAIPATTSETGKASWEQGFPVETSLPLTSGGIPPKYGDFNGVLKALSEFAVYAQSGGQYSYSSTLDYSVGSIVVGTDGYIYRAAQTNGPSSTVKNPVGDTSGTWEKIVSQSDLSAITSSLGAVTSTAADAYANASAANGAVTTLDANVVKLSGNQNVGGVKTFSNGIIVSSGVNISGGGLVSLDGNISIKRSTTSGLSNLYFTENNGTATAMLRQVQETDGTPRLQIGERATSGTEVYTGPQIWLYRNGNIKLRATDSSGINAKDLNMSNSNIEWDGKDIITNGGDQTISGIKTFSDTIVTSGYYSLRRPTTDSCLRFLAGSDGSISGGAKLELFGGTESTNAGIFRIQAGSGTAYKQLIGQPDGTLTWDGKGFVYTSGKQELTGSVQITNSQPRIDLIENDVEEHVTGGGWQGMFFHDKNTTEVGGVVFIVGSTENTLAFRVKVNGTADTPSIAYRNPISTGTPAFCPYGNNNRINLGQGGNLWKQVFAGTTTISTSDERLKSNISAIPDDVLDAWEDVQWSQYQFNDAVAEKGENARIHNGLVAQRIDAIFSEHGIDVSKYGFFCHDEWTSQEEQKDTNGNIIATAQEAGDAYALRYEEALCIEAAYQRRRADRAEARITALEQHLAEMEQAIAALAGGAE